MGSKSKFEVGFPQKKSQEHFLNDWLKTAFIKLIAEETGLEIKKHDQTSLDEKIFSRMKINKIIFPDNYYQLLASKTMESRQEWQSLVHALTNSESFFFRDKGHFKLLENRIIPELIQRNQKTRTIRVCSAGCSTGEEPYSLAILLNELIPDPDQWNLLILGLDVNSLSIEKAKAGIYRSWSFRGVAPEIKSRYFKAVNDEYHIDLKIKRMLKFQTSNLVKDSFPHPNSEMKEMDLIVCRNVFIYFEKAAISKALENFYMMLKPCGYLLTGHTELYAQKLNKFELKLFDEGSIHQCLDHPSSITSESVTQSKNVEIEDDKKSFDEVKADEDAASGVHVKHLVNPDQHLGLKHNLTPNFDLKVSRMSLKDEKKFLRNAELLMQKKAYNLAIVQVERALEIDSKNFYSYYLMARLFNSINNQKKSTLFCRKALDIDAFSILPYYVLADIAKKNKLSEAKKILKKIIYLEPGSVAAYLKLSYVYHAENDVERARKMQEVALSILRQLPAKMEILELDHLTVTQLILQLEVTLEAND